MRFEEVFRFFCHENSIGWYIKYITLFQTIVHKWSVRDLDLSYPYSCFEQCCYALLSNRRKWDLTFWVFEGHCLWAACSPALNLCSDCFLLSLKSCKSDLFRTDWFASTADKVTCFEVTLSLSVHMILLLLYQCPLLWNSYWCLTKITSVWLVNV